MKAELIRRLKRLELDRGIQGRLRTVVVEVARGRDRREYRAYCRLARKVASPELRDRLVALAASEDDAVRRRAGWMLAAVDQPEPKRTGGR